MQFGTAQNINEIYDSVDHEVVLSLLVHKVKVISCFYPGSSEKNEPTINMLIIYAFS